MRLMEHAVRFGMPIFASIDSPGACRVQRQKTGSRRTIAVPLRESFGLDVPILCTVIGEGGSGGALGIGVGIQLVNVRTFELIMIASLSLGGLSSSGKMPPKPLKPQKPSKLRLEISQKSRYSGQVPVARTTSGAHSEPLKAAATLSGLLLTHLEELTQMTSQHSELRVTLSKNFVALVFHPKTSA